MRQRDTGWKPNPRNPWEMTWKDDDRRDEALKGDRFGPKQRMRRYHYPHPAFLAEVARMYRAAMTPQADAEAERVELQAYVDIIEPLAAGALVAGILRKARTASLSAGSQPSTPPQAGAVPDAARASRSPGCAPSTAIARPHSQGRAPSGQA